MRAVVDDLLKAQPREIDTAKLPSHRKFCSYLGQQCHLHDGFFAPVLDHFDTTSAEQTELEREIASPLVSIDHHNDGILTTTHPVL